MTQLTIITPQSADALLENTVRILAREFQNRGVESCCQSTAPSTGPTLSLQIDDQLPPESFEIQRPAADHLRIVAGDSHGALYGCGHVLRQCRIEPDRLVLPQSQPLSVPGKAVRGMYFPVHMYNFYQVAPIPEVTRYIEQLALCGINTLTAYYHMFHFTGADDPACQDWLQRLKIIFDTARSVGMKTGVLLSANDTYLQHRPDLRYIGDVPRNWGAEICPSKPGAIDYIRDQSRKIFQLLDAIDILVLWPYDSGGCRCDQCYPWGGNGYLRAAKAITDTLKELHPHATVILSTWMFDYNCGELGEWDALYRKLDQGELDWVDMLMADGAFLCGFFPQRVLDQPPSKPVLNFLEICMNTGAPWGSFGANPIPGIIEREWKRVGQLIVGGTPYTEGIFDDVNKFIWSQLCWSPQRRVHDILLEYAVYEFSPEHAADIVQAIEQIENVGRREPLTPGEQRLNLPDTSKCEQVWQTLEPIDRALPLRVRQSWRWRLLFLRALIDVELTRSGGRPTAALGRAYDELISIYHIDDNALWLVRPYEVELAAPARPNHEAEYRFAQHGKRISELCADSDIDESEVAIA